MSKPAPLIDFKAEWAVANDNFASYQFIKEQFHKTMSRYPNQNGDLIIDVLCDQSDMKRSDFNFINSVEKQYWLDLMSSIKPPPKDLK